MKSKEFIGTCVENPFERIELLAEIVENAKKIFKKKFFEHCFIHPDIIKAIKQFPNDYEFYQYKDIMFYEWSGIEHFYQ